MALVVKDRVRVTTTTTGTTDFTLGGAVTGYQSFSVIGSGNQTYYAAQDPATGDWEVGIGTYSSTGPTLSRDTILESSNAGSKVVFAAGSKDVFCTYPAERSVYLDVAGSYPVQSTFDTITATTATLTNGTITTTPTDGIDLVNKTYVDTIAGTGLTYHAAVNYESPNTVGNLTATYTNGGTTPTWTTITNNKEVATGSAHGLSEHDVIVFSSTTNGITAGTAYFVKSTPTSTSITLSLTYDGAEITSLTNGTGLSIGSRANSGVGATLVNAGTQTALVIDGVSVVVGNRVLIYSQTNAYENGVYEVTNVGSGSTNWILTRTSDANKYGPLSTNTLGQNDAFYVLGGNTGKGETYVLSTTGTIVFGTTSLSFTQISSAQVYSAGTGLNLSPATTFNISNTGVVAATYGSASTVPVIAVNAQGQITSATNTSIAITAGAVSGLAASATTDTTNAANISSGTLNSARLSGSYTGITGVGTLTAGTWNGSVIGATYGGTGLSSYAVGDLIYADTTTSLAKLADVVSGNVLLSGGVGTAPAWGQVGLTTHVTGTLPVGNGGTGITAGTSGGIPYFSASNTIASSAALTASAIVIGGGAGVAPSTTTTGTGVLTAIGNAVNTANGVVTQTATLTSSALLLGGGSGTGISSTTTGTGVVTAVGNAVNTSGGLVTQSGTLTASALLIGGGASTAISSTTTGTGVVTALGNNANAAGGFTTIDGTATLTNKRVTQRCNAQTTTASPFAWNSDSYDQQSFSALANALTINADAGTPTDGQRTVFRIKDDGTARALTWTTGSSKAFRAIGVTLPTTTVINKTVYVGCIYNAADDRWDAVAVAQEA